MKRFLSCFILLGLLLTTQVEAAGYSKPLNIPTYVVPDYNVTIAIFATQTAVGEVVGMFEQRSDGWYFCGNACTLALEYPTLAGPVSYAGGVNPFVIGLIPRANEILAAKFPAMAGPQPVTGLTPINNKLATGQFGMVNGVPQFGVP